MPIIVIKRDGSREAFSREKQSLQNSLVREATSQEIGEMVLGELRKIDEVAYVRFASVYRQFKDVDSFLREIKALTSDENR